jgi:hypothetical protein
VLRGALGSPVLPSGDPCSERRTPW